MDRHCARGKAANYALAALLGAMWQLAVPHVGLAQTRQPPPKAAVASEVASHDDPSSIVARLPVEVLEVATGGTWSEGSAASGSYRTVTLQSSADADRAEVFLQWIGTRTISGPYQIISSLPLREFNDKHWGSASVSLETEIDNEARIAIAAQDRDGKPTMMTVIARLPGRYEVVIEPEAPESAKRP